MRRYFFTHKTKCHLIRGVLWEKDDWAIYQGKFFQWESHFWKYIPSYITPPDDVPLRNVGTNNNMSVFIVKYYVTGRQKISRSEKNKPYGFRSPLNYIKKNWLIIVTHMFHSNFVCWGSEHIHVARFSQISISSLNIIEFPPPFTISTLLSC